MRLETDTSNESTKTTGESRRFCSQTWSMIDPEDAEVFAQFEVDYTRLHTERSEGRLLTPDRIFQYLGSISFIR